MPFQLISPYATVPFRFEILLDLEIRFLTNKSSPVLFASSPVIGLSAKAVGHFVAFFRSFIGLSLLVIAMYRSTFSGALFPRDFARPFSHPTSHLFRSFSGSKNTP